MKRKFFMVVFLGMFGVATGLAAATNPMAAACPAAAADPAGVAGAFPYENSRYIVIDDVELHFRFWFPESDQHRGSVLLIHGFGASTYSWEAAAEHMQAMGFEVVAIDIPPFGYSEKSSRLNQSNTARAMLVRDFLAQAFPDRRWHFAGHSMGGAIAQAFSLMYPDQLLSVTFVAGALFSTLDESQSGNQGFLSAWPMRNLAGMLARSCFITPRRVGKLLASAYGKPPSREQVHAYLQPLMIPGTATAIMASPRNSEEIMTLQASGLAVPSLAIWGEKDRWVPFESKKKVLDMMPATDVQIIAGAGHNPMETHLPEFMEAWTRFINSLDPN
jgi:pimeloyl-ACP methyl ester carboxylesterase